jgi:hypothetical protein
MFGSLGVIHFEVGLADILVAPDERIPSELQGDTGPVSPPTWVVVPYVGTFHLDLLRDKPWLR